MLGLLRFFTAIALGMAALPASAERIRTVEIGSWLGGAYTNDRSGEFTHCAASASYKSGIIVTFSISRGLLWSMSFSNKAWRLNRNSSFEIAFTIDDMTPIFAQARAIDYDAIIVRLEDSAELFRRFQQGQMLKVATAKTLFRFNLTDTARLLPVLLSCAQNRGAPAVADATTNPFSKKDTAPAKKAEGQADPTTLAEANVFAANLLSSAGVKFTLLGPKESPDIKGHARWFDGTTFGSLSLFPSATPEEIKGLGAFLIGRDAGQCKGSYLSGAIPDQGAGNLSRVFTTCQSGEKATTVYYLALPRKTGGAYVISTISIGSEAAAKERDASLREAAFKLTE